MRRIPKQLDLIDKRREIGSCLNSRKCAMVDFSENPNEGNHGGVSEPSHESELVELSALENLMARVDSGPPSFGQYEILGVVSIGKNSKVFRARDTKLLRLVSLKICDGINTRQDKNAILSEGRALARIDSRHVTRCYSVEDINDTLVLVNEWIEGQTLEQYMFNNQLSYRQVLALFQKIVSGVGAIHAQGLLHRDLKPSNIIVDADGQPKIIDFGLAQENSEPNPWLSGTLSWAAPEVVNSKTESIGPPTDIFGLGAVLYFMLTGQPLYTGEAKERLLEKARSCRIKPSHEIAGTSANKLDRICMQCLSPEPAQRYQSTEQLAAELRSDTWNRVAAAAGIVVLGLVILITLSANNSKNRPKSKSNANNSVNLIDHRQRRTANSNKPPIVYLKFDEFEGEWVRDQSNNHFDGELYYDITLNDLGVSKGCAALNFLGIRDETACVAVVEKRLKTPVEQRTISLWFNANEVGGEKQVLYEEGSDDRGLNIYLDSGKLYVGRWNFKKQTFLKTNVTSGCWHHVCLVFDSHDGPLGDEGQQGRIRGYLDGQQFGEGEAASLHPYEGHICIGRQDLNWTRFHDVESDKINQFPFTGRVDELRVFEQPLTADQVKRLHEEIQAE